MSPATMLAFPEASSCTVMSCAIAVGAVVSETVTVLITCVALLPEASSASRAWEAYPGAGLP